MTEKTYDFSDTLPDLGGGVFLGKISRAIQETAFATVEHSDGRKKGKVVIELTMQRVGEASQIVLTHKVAYDKPTKRGKSTEEDATETMLYVTNKGGLTVLPDTQEDWVGERG